MMVYLIGLATLVALWVEMMLIVLIITKTSPNWWSVPTVVMLGIIASATFVFGLHLVLGDVS